MGERGNRGGGELEGNGSGMPPVRYGRKIQLTDEERIASTPPTQYRPPARKSKLWLILVIIVAVAAVASFAGYTYLVPGGSSPPEDAFRGFVDAVNAGDASRAVDYTVDKFASDATKEAEIEALEADWTENGRMTITIHSVEVIHRSEVGPSVRTQFDDLENQVESLYGVIVKDSCNLVFNTTTVRGAETNSGDGNVPLAMIGSSWYIATIYDI